ncbi:P-loop NTPase fold protein [Phaeobacter inhibens]|uniref:KAP family P-loop NTPase fold protein n=1 Tax=Phaeobacter inhibens TaxID=221822 RepID=UPI000C9B5BAD|nr:P-loop NTPase fold protein [Phaeobacter inhibens]AUQ65689.1 KAP family P-loop domain protein [Phaeobacter inhibens]
MRLTVPDPKIKLYEDGFAGHDHLAREDTGHKLSDLVEHIDDPLVIALDGAWGSGKSFFLKCWVGEHRKPEHGHTAETVYFDAFKHDYLDEPLIALTKAITDRLPQDSVGRKFLKSSKRIVSKLAMPTARIVGAVATGGATEVTGALADAAIRSGWKEAEKAAEEFWNKQTAKTAAMDQFRSALEQLTAPDELGTPQKKLVVVVDELDRCRPDYALSLLEIIKHFFNVDGVHFVLGVNLKELQNSVKARYGSGVDAAKYLQRFISIEMPLRSTTANGYEPATYSKHFLTVAAKMNTVEMPLFSLTKRYLEMANHHFEITLRDVEKISTLLAVTTYEHIETLGARHLLAGLIVLKITAPHLIDAARRKELDFNELNQAFLLGSRTGQGGIWNEARQSWLLATTKNMNEDLGPDEPEALKLLFKDDDPQEVLRLVIAYNLDSFVLP